MIARRSADDRSAPAMDDVGAGYAGLSRVLQVRPQLIKLDRELVTGLGDDPAARALLPDGSWWFHPVMSTSPTTSVQEALERALTHAAADRFAPVLITSREGALLGGALVEDLVAHVTRGTARNGPPPVPRQAGDVVDLEGTGA